MLFDVKFKVQQYIIIFDVNLYPDGDDDAGRYRVLELLGLGICLSPASSAVVSSLMIPRLHDSVSLTNLDFKS